MSCLRILSHSDTQLIAQLHCCLWKQSDTEKTNLAQIICSHIQTPSCCQSATSSIIIIIIRSDKIVQVLKEVSLFSLLFSVFILIFIFIFHTNRKYQYFKTTTYIVFAGNFHTYSFLTFFQRQDKELNKALTFRKQNLETIVI